MTKPNTVQASERELMQWIVESLFHFRFEPSRIDPKYTCCICDSDTPKSMRGKAYKWDDKSICIGSFETEDYPKRRPFHYCPVYPLEDSASILAILAKCAEKVDPYEISIGLHVYHSGAAPKWMACCSHDRSGTQVFEDELTTAIAQFARKLFEK